MMQASPDRRQIACLALVLGAGAWAVASEPIDGRRAPTEKYAPTPGELRASYDRAEKLAATAQGRVFRARLVPHWLGDGRRFWYRNDNRGGTREFLLVDAEEGSRAPAFDHRRLAESLSRAAGKDYSADKLPFDEIEFLDDAGAIGFRVDRDSWRCDLDSYECKKADREAERKAPEGGGRLPEPDRGGPSPRRRGRPGDDAPEWRSPDGKWVASIRDDNVVVRPSGGGEESRLSDNGQPDFAYGSLAWSPDSKTLVGYRIDRAEPKQVHLIESSPREGGRAKVHSRPYPLPGDEFPSYEMWLFDVAERKATKADVDRIDLGGAPDLRWRDGGRRFAFEKTDRGHRRFRVVEVDAQSGRSRAIIDETSETFIWTAHTEGLGLRAVNWLEKSDEILYASERDGWRHLYLIDAKSGVVDGPITKGEYVVRGIDRIDEEDRQVWFRASGKVAGQDPYLVHFYRVGFDGSGLVDLTPGDGNHAVRYSPDRKYLIDTYSRVDMPPVHELRRVADGSLVLELERADVSALEESGWRPPEVFRAKGRDGRTDIWGVVYRPRKLDESRLYPIVEHIYAGPQGSFVPKTFAPYRPFESLAELGFIVVQVDGMGTANRSKAFHDACWHNLADAGFPDRIPWIKALAGRYPYMDAARVGAYGTSAGGQSSAGAVLFHPGFYKAAVSSCGCHDNRMDKASWNEQWMGYPVGPHYAEQSNVTNAHRLRGKLMLIVGELDDNVPPESTLRLADALIRAGKDFDLLLIPGMGHSDGGRYGERRRRDFFVRHLHGVEPPDRNAPGSTKDEAVRLTAHADAKPARSSPGEAGDPDDLGPPPSELAAAIERYTTDARTLARSLGPSDSPSRRERLQAFDAGWLDRLAGRDFDALGRDGRVDYLLLKNHLESSRRGRDIDAGRAEEQAPLLPFAKTILDLEESRRRMEPIDSPGVAATLTDLVKRVGETRKAIEAGRKSGDEPGGLRAEKSVAYRAVETASRLRDDLGRWFGFYHDYDPVFTWWVAEPYKAADRALQDYAKFLREEVVGIKPGDDEAIVGDPVGREALLAALKSEMIPYTPEELMAIAEKEFAWCEDRMKEASRDLGCGDDWKKALEIVKERHVEPGKQPALIRDLADEAIRFLDDRDLVTIPPLARQSWRMGMMSPRRQLVNPFFTGGEVISVSYPTSTMTHEQKLMSMRGNNIHFSRATVHHELIPGHHLQRFMADRHRRHRRPFETPFLVEGWALYWEMVLWDKGFPKSAEDRVGMLFWRMHRCARILFSLGFHLGEMTPRGCIDLLVDRVGHERDNATAEVRRSFDGSYPPLYQCAYMLGALQMRALRQELVDPGKMTERQFHDAVLKENAIPIELIRASLTGQELRRDFATSWKFAGEVGTKE